MHAHLDLVVAGDPDDLDIGPAGEHSRRQHPRRCQVHRRDRLADQAGQVRVSDRDGQPGQPLAARLRRPGAEHGNRAHVDGELAVRLHPDRPRPGPGADRQLRPGGEALLEQVAGEDPDPVPAHLRDAAVGVPVVHEPLGRIRVDRVRPGGGCPHDPKHAVGTDPEPPVAQRRDELRLQLELPLRIRHDDEIVPRAVPLSEPHPPMLSGQPGQAAKRLTAG